MSFREHTALLLALLVGTVAGIGGYTFVYAKGYAYLTDDPGACANCHVMLPQYESWSKPRTETSQAATTATRRAAFSPSTR